MSDPATLRSVLRALSGDEQVNWDEAERVASQEDSRLLLQELRVIAQISAAHGDAAAARVLPFRLGANTHWGALRVLALLGTGADGDVYRAYDERLQREVALKLLRRPGGDRYVSHALDEARLLARVRHPNIVTVHGADVVDGQAGVWMELVEGETLQALVSRQGPMGADEAAVIGAEVCRGLAAIHQAGILHRDIKAQNIMRESGGRIVVMDFSVSRADESQRPGLAGTPAYVAPELFTGTQASPRSDLYGVGVLLYYLVTGTHPVTGTTIAEIAGVHQDGRAKRLRDARADLPAAFVAAIDRALSVDPDSRPSSAGEFEDLLLGTLTRHTIGRDFAAGGRGRRWMLGALVAALLMAAGGAWTQWSAFRDSSRATVPVETRPWVLVASFDNRTGDTSLDGVLEHALERELISSSHVRVASRARVDDVLRLMQLPVDTRIDGGRAREVALRDGGIATVIGGRIERVGSTIVLSASMVDAASGATHSTVSEDATGAAKLSPAIRRLANRLRESLGEAVPAIRLSTEQLERVTTPSLKALRVYSESYDAGGRNEWAAALPLARAAVEEDPSFAAAHTWLAWALMRNRSNQDEYMKAADTGVALSSSASEWERLWIIGSQQSLSGDQAGALGSYEALLQLYPDHFWGASNFVRGNLSLGRHAQAVRPALRQLELRPRDYNSLYLVLDLFRSLGRLEEAAGIAERIRNSDGYNSNPSGDAWVFDAFLAWHKGDAAASVRELRRTTTEALQLRPELKDAVLARSALLWLAAGRPSDAEAALLGASPSAERHVAHATIAHARGDDARARQEVALANVGHLDTDARPRQSGIAIWLMARISQPAAVRQLFTTVTARASQGSTPAVVAIADLLAGEAAFAEGANAETIRRLSVNRWGLVGDGFNFRAAETLAEALARTGDLAAAAQSLEPVASVKHLAAYDHAYWWMRCQVRRTELYLQLGRHADAVAIARELEGILAEAEPGFPLADRVRDILNAAPYGLAAK